MIRTTRKRSNIRNGDRITALHHLCDLCEQPCWPSKDPFGHVDLKVQREGATTVVDCCVRCAERVVLPALRELGFRPRKPRVSWEL